ncbi:MAG: endonuclease [Burkholderiales bacterium PBB2]|nr:MAG: endonuclease [Burkholderiales bacterium PBB2]
MRWMLAVLAMAGLLVCDVSAAAGPSPSPSPSFQIATYNLRLNLASDGPNAWPLRAEAVKALIRYHEFDVFGTQEGLPEQIDELSRMDEFAHVGVGRDDGKRAGEHSAIFFRKARFEALSSGDFWLSQTPDVPSKGWDARCCNRLASWVQLRDRESQRRFFVFSVHFDHEGEVARKESAKLLLHKVKEIAGTAPVICLGDFNSTPETEQIQRMQAALRDAYRVSQSPPYGPVGTFNAFKIDAPMTARIDYLFLSPGITVLKYGALSDSQAGRFPSDHHPVLLRVRLD